MPAGKCKKCENINRFIYFYHGKKYCHEYFRSIAEMVDEQAKKRVASLQPNDYVLYPDSDKVYCGEKA